MPGDREHFTEFESGFGNAAPLEHPRRRSGETPIGDVPFLILHIEINPDVWIGPLHSARRKVSRALWCRTPRCTHGERTPRSERARPAEQSAGISRAKSFLYPLRRDYSRRQMRAQRVIGKVRSPES